MSFSELYQDTATIEKSEIADTNFKDKLLTDSNSRDEQQKLRDEFERTDLAIDAYDEMKKILRELVMGDTFASQRDEYLNLSRNSRAFNDKENNPYVQLSFILCTYLKTIGKKGYLWEAQQLLRKWIAEEKETNTNTKDEETASNSNQGNQTTNTETTTENTDTQEGTTKENITIPEGLNEAEAASYKHFAGKLEALKGKDQKEINKALWDDGVLEGVGGVLEGAGEYRITDNILSKLIMKYKDVFQKTNKLKLGFNYIRDISALEGWINLNHLSLNQNKISDITAVKGLKNLTHLYLIKNEISDISALKNLTQLTTCYFSYNEVLAGKMGDITFEDFVDNGELNHRAWSIFCQLTALDSVFFAKSGNRYTITKKDVQAMKDDDKVDIDGIGSDLFNQIDKKTETFDVDLDNNPFKDETITATDSKPAVEVFFDWLKKK